MTTPTTGAIGETAVVARPVRELKAVAISGSPRSPSKSKALALRFLEALAERGCATEMIDIADLPAEALAVRGDSETLDDAIAAVGAAHIVIAASPTYRALYTGVLKCFFDLMPQGHLAGKLCVGLQTGTAPQHALSPEYGYRPLFASLEGVPFAVLYATDDEFPEGQPNEALITKLGELATRVVQAA